MVREGGRRERVSSTKTLPSVTRPLARLEDGIYDEVVASRRRRRKEEEKELIFLPSFILASSWLVFVLISGVYCSRERERQPRLREVGRPILGAKDSQLSSLLTQDLFYSQPRLRDTQSQFLITRSCNCAVINICSMNTEEIKPGDHVLYEY